MNWRTFFIVAAVYDLVLGAAFFLSTGRSGSSWRSSCRTTSRTSTSLPPSSLLAGWVLMPAVLVASLAWPIARYGLVVPASLVTLGLLAIVVAWLPPSPWAAAGGVLMLLGIGLGSVMGLWLWYRLLPVPVALEHPFSAARWRLIVAHVALIVGGMALAAIPLF